MLCVLGYIASLSLLCDLFKSTRSNWRKLLRVLCRWPSAPAILLADGMRFLSMRARMPSRIFWSSASTFATYSFALDERWSLSCFLCCLQFVPLCQQPHCRLSFLSLANASRSQPPSHVFRSSESFSANDLATSAICNCLLLLLLFHPFFFNSASFFPQLQFPLHSRVGVLLLSRQPSILVLLPCVDDFQYPCFSSSVQPTSFLETLFSKYVSACNWHCSFLFF